MMNRILLVILLAAPAFAASGPSPCAANLEARQLDYWLGEWSVGTAGAPNTGHSKVSISLDKCLFNERWGSDTTSHAGENALAYSSEDSTWYALFVDNQGRVHALKGAVKSGLAEFEGPGSNEKGQKILTKVKVVRVSQDNVEQIWQKSSDGGATWNTDVRMQYSRKRP
jgi:hypothetical protein